MLPSQQVREGVLASATFPTLIYSILSRDETGVVTLTADAVEKSIYIQEGRPVFATSSDREDRLGELLFRQGRVSLAGLMDSIEASLRGGKRLGAVLVEKGLIQPHDLVEGVRQQVRSIITGLFLWTRGRYRYAPGPLPTEEVITLKLSASDLILEGIRRVESWSRVWEAVGGLGVRYQATGRTDKLAGDLNLSLEEWTVLSRCERPAALRDLCRASKKMSDFELCRFLWAMQTLGLLRRCPAEE